MSDDIINKTRDDVVDLVKDYFAIAPSESETLLKIAKQCAVQGGIPLAGAGATALAATGTVVVPLLGTIPGWLAGALAGFIGGTTACVIARRSTAEQVKDILRPYGKSEVEFKSEVKRMISKVSGGAGYCKKI